MAKITLLRKSTVYNAKSSSYQLALEVLNAEDITRNVFVKQRIKNVKTNKIDDISVAICSPTQLEDLDENSPSPDTSYFRVSNAEFTSSHPDYLEDVFKSVLADLQRLVTDYEALNELQADGVYEITASNIDVETNFAMHHTHYRLPLSTAPCGTNDLFDDAGTMRHIVGNQNTTLRGWLNASGSGTPAGFSFKYNIQQDTALRSVWPIPADKIDYAHLVIDGVSRDSSDVRITENGIYWRDNQEGQAPWAQDYVDSNNPGIPQNQRILVLDFIY